MRCVPSLIVVVGTLAVAPAAAQSIAAGARIHGVSVIRAYDGEIGPPPRELVPAVPLISRYDLAWDEPSGVTVLPAITLGRPLFDASTLLFTSYDGGAETRAAGATEPSSPGFDPARVLFTHFEPEPTRRLDLPAIRLAPLAPATHGPTALPAMHFGLAPRPR